MIIQTVILCATVAAAAAQDAPPRFDVDALCSAAATTLGNSAFAKSACYEQEQGAYDSLKARWASVPAEVRTTCQKMANWTGSGSYTVLGGCVDIETEARSRGTPSFKY